MPSELVRWRMPLSALIGVAFGLLFAIGTQFPDAPAGLFLPVSLLCAPGLVVLVPIFFLTGGPHGFLGVLIVLVPLANGISYWLVTLLFLHVKACILGSSAPSQGSADSTAQSRAINPNSTAKL